VLQHPERTETCLWDRQSLWWRRNKFRPKI